MSMNQGFGRRPRGRFLYFIPVILAVAAALSAVVMLLWNYVMPELFGVRKIGFAHAFCLLALCRILFGNFGGKGGKTGAGMRGNPMMQKWKGMNEEERSSFRDEWRKRCGR